ncbi:MAG TPA: EthD family reductase [Pseudonocardiaceae bacterium]
MIKYIALYRKPADTEAFAEKYFATHLPLVAKTPGLVRCEVARVQRTYVPGFLGDTEPFLIAEMYFESKEAMKTAFASEEWKAAGANLAEIGGMELVAMFAAEVLENANEDQR